MKTANPQNIKIGIVGSGVVGSATGRGLAKKGFDITFIDTNRDVVEKLNQEHFQAFLPEDFINGNWNFDISMVSVPTPTVNKAIKLTYLKAAVEEIGRRLATYPHYHLVVVRSTVLPGTTENFVIPLLEKKSGKKVGRDFGVCMNPEFLRAKSALADFSNPRLTVFGEYDKKSGDMLEQVYRVFEKPIYRVTLREAEFQKYVHNLFNAAKISFFNEMRGVGKSIGIDPQKAFNLVAASAEGMWNPSYATKDMGPFGGVCLPKDTQAFLSWGEALGFSLPLLRTTIAVNEFLILKNARERELLEKNDSSRVY
jgi:UDPglucose 6-dehydrogenase